MSKTNLEARRLLVVAAVFMLGVAWAPRQAAADGGDGAFRLGADAGLLSVQHYFDGGGGRSATDLQLGLYPAGAGVNAGLQFGQLVIGARVGAGHRDFSFGGFGGSASFVQFAPFFEFLFSDGDIQPFIGAQAGFRGDFPGGGGPDWISFEPIALGGLHFFLEESFSISPTAYAGFRYTDIGGNGWGAFSTGIFVSLNGWIS